MLCILFSCERTLCSDSDEDEDSPVNALPMSLVRDPNALLIALPADVTAPVISLPRDPKNEPIPPNGFHPPFDDEVVGEPEIELFDCAGPRCLMAAISLSPLTPPVGVMIGG